MNNTSLIPNNATNNSSGYYCKYDEPDTQLEYNAKRIALILLMTLGLAGNIFVIVLAVKYTVRKNLHHLIINMAVSDTLYILITLIRKTIVWLSERKLLKYSDGDPWALDASPRRSIGQRSVRHVPVRFGARFESDPAFFERRIRPVIKSEERRKKNHLCIDMFRIEVKDDCLVTTFTWDKKENKKKSGVFQNMRLVRLVSTTGETVVIERIEASFVPQWNVWSYNVTLNDKRDESMFTFQAPTANAVEAYEYLKIHQPNTRPSITRFGGLGPSSNTSNSGGLGSSFSTTVGKFEHTFGSNNNNTTSNVTYPVKAGFTPFGSRLPLFGAKAFPEKEEEERMEEVEPDPKRVKTSS
ncbi:hypothetical protein AC249_AIPGENE24618 [Exaiptasia diaphana]|nr:hypothetical protein AC249_AIPGENE24618 [Exaiptasia diaphana]